MHESLRPNGELPRLRDPLLIGAFWGWGDGTGSAMGTIRYLRAEWGASEVATVDPDRYYDLTVARPRSQPRNGVPNIRWPGTRFHVASPTGADRDVVLLAGREPSLAWRDYAALVADFMRQVGAKQFLALGSRPAMIPHTRPAPVLLVDSDQYFEDLTGRKSEPSTYQGPTGIQTVVSLHLRQEGFNTGRITALVPGYVNIGPNPRAVAALVQALDKALGSNTSIEPLIGEIESYDERTSEALSQLADPAQMRDQIRQMEELYDSDPAAQQDLRNPEPAAPPESDLPSGEELLEGIESFLRQNRNDVEGPGSQPS